MRAYLCVMENTKDNNIHENQIFPLFNGRSNMIAIFIAPLFILNRKGFKVNNQTYTKKYVHHVRIPFFSYNFSMNPLLLPFFLLLSLPIAYYYIKKFKITEVHARNHLSALVAITLKKLGLKLKLLSDLRGLYSEEGVILKRWKYNSAFFIFWKKIENLICTNSDHVTTISKSFTRHLNEKYKVTNVSYVPALVDTDKFFYSNKLRSDFRKDYNIDIDEIVFIYVGSFGLWHDLDSFYKFVGKYVTEFSIKKPRVFILSNINQKPKNELHLKYNAKVMTVEPTLVNYFLCGCDIGVLPGTSKSGTEYDMLYETMISSKLEEYLVTGLNVIVNQRIKEVHSMVQDDISKIKHLNDNERRLYISDKYRDKFCSKIIMYTYDQIFQGLK